jgi:type III restriction enzyme
MPRDAVIENPVVNSPFRVPDRHFRFDERGITSDVTEGRRRSSYFIPIPSARKIGSQLAFETEWTSDRLQENETINRIRERVDLWRQGGHQGVTTTTRRLLDYWTEPDRERPLFFCQIEALETAIYIGEAAARFGDDWIVNLLRDEAGRHNPGLFRVAHKMATGTGKTVVMAMVIAWHTLNKAASPQDNRLSAPQCLIGDPATGITENFGVAGTKSHHPQRIDSRVDACDDCHAGPGPTFEPLHVERLGVTTVGGDQVVELGWHRPRVRAEGWRSSQSLRHVMAPECLPNQAS